MVRLNLLLLLILLVCALSVVASNHRARKVFSELETGQKRMRDLDVEWGQLQLEQSTLAAHVRIERSAREKLGMKPPGPAQIISVDAASAR